MAEFEDLTNPPDRVLVVVAHPDDIDFGTAGTVAALTNAGSQVTYCLVTSGEAGIPEEMDRDELKALRVSEQTDAAAAVGVTDLMWLNQADGHLEYNLALRSEISKAIRIAKPDLVITQSPVRRWDHVYASHPDHLAVAESTMAAVYPDARNPHSHPHLLAEGYEPHAVPEVWVGGLEPVDVFIDITNHMDQKVAALSSHKSQVGFVGDVDAFLRSRATETAAVHGLAAGSMVECFRRAMTA